MSGTVEVWVARPGEPCYVDERSWRVHFEECDGTPYKWGELDLSGVDAPWGRWSGALPPGVYVVYATRAGERGGPGLESDRTIVQVPCDGHACVRLYVRGGRQPSSPRPSTDGGREPPREPSRPGGPTRSNRPPTAVIESPKDGATLVADSDGSGEPSARVVLSGRGTDAEDGALAGKSLRWFDSVDGGPDVEVGQGTQVAASLRLRPGAGATRHRITLRATDREGASGTASILVTVTAELR